MWEGMNQRRFPRVKSRCIVKLRQEGAAPPISTLTENVGLGGVCVLLEKELNIFSPVELELSLSDGKSEVRSQGTIVWVVRRRDLKGKISFDTGIEFVELSAEDRARLEAVLDKVSQKSAP